MLQSNLVTNDNPANLCLPNTGNSKAKSSSSDFSSLLNEISDNADTTSNSDDSVNNLAASMLLFLFNTNTNSSSGIVTADDSTPSQLTLDSVGNIEGSSGSDTDMMNLLDVFGNTTDDKKISILDVVNDLFTKMNADDGDSGVTKNQILSFMNQYIDTTNQSNGSAPVVTANQSASVDTANQSILSTPIDVTQQNNESASVAATANQGNGSGAVDTTNQSNLSPPVVATNQSNSNIGADALSQGNIDIDKLVSSMKEVLEAKGNSDDVDKVKELLTNLKSAVATSTPSKKAIINRSGINQIIPNDLKLGETPKNDLELDDTSLKSLSVENVALNTGSSSKNAGESENDGSFQSSGELSNGKDALSSALHTGNSKVDFSSYTLKNTSDVKAEVGNVVKDSIVKNSFSVNELGQKDMEIQLNPDNLGKVTIRLQSNRGEMNIKIFASNAEVKDAISVQTSQIVEAMKEQGIKVNHLDVIYSSLSSDLSNQSNGSHYQHTNKQSQGQARAEYEQHSLSEFEASDVPLLYNSSVEYIV